LLITQAMRRKRSVATVGVVIATIAILPLTILALWACGWYSGLTTAPREESPEGVAQGTVWTADLRARTMRVTWDPFGIRTVPFALTEQTRVVVGDKEGAFGDLYEGTAVRVTYERRDTVLVARCVEALRDDDVGETDVDRCGITVGVRTPR
jgi:hypothetical protein